MADQKATAKTGAENVRFLPSDQVPIRFSDAFLIAGGTDIYSLNFYQTEIPALEGTIKNVEVERHDATCFARVALSPIGFVRLLTSMAERVGMEVTKTSESKAKEGGK